MQRVTFKNSRNLTLVGNLFTSHSKSIVILSHALANDKSERGKLDAVALKLNQSGYNVLAFDFSGCGESDDDTLTIGKQVDDLQSAINFSKLLDFNKIGLFGHSIGCLVSLKCYNHDISTMVLWSPVTNNVKYSWNEKLTSEQIAELKEKGYYTRTRKNAVRTTYLIDKQMLTERESINQTELLKDVNCPILLVHGTMDESVPLTDSEDALKLLSKDSRLEIVEDADHDFSEHMNILVSLTNDWFVKYLER